MPNVEDHQAAAASAVKALAEVVIQHGEALALLGMAKAMAAMLVAAAVSGDGLASIPHRARILAEVLGEECNEMADAARRGRPN